MVHMTADEQADAGGKKNGGYLDVSAEADIAEAAEVIFERALEGEFGGPEGPAVVTGMPNTQGSDSDAYLLNGMFDDDGDEPDPQYNNSYTMAMLQAAKNPPKKGGKKGEAITKQTTSSKTAKQTAKPETPKPAKAENNAEGSVKKPAMADTIGTGITAKTEQRGKGQTKKKGQKQEAGVGLKF